MNYITLEEIANKLWNALYTDNLNDIKDILQEYKNIAIEQQWFNRLLLKACEIGNLKVIKYLFKQPNTDIHCYDDYAMLLARNNYHLHIVKYLIKKGLNILADEIHHIYKDNIYIRSTSTYGNRLICYLLYNAIKYNKKDDSIQMVKYILKITNGKNLDEFSKNINHTDLIFIDNYFEYLIKQKNKLKLYDFKLIHIMIIKN